MGASDRIIQDPYDDAALEWESFLLGAAPGELQHSRLTDEELREAEEAARGLHPFVRAAWSQIEPKPFVDNWHIGAICEHLEAVTKGEIKRLLIVVPPRTSKSIAASTMWPVWSWIWDAKIRWLFGSYVEKLSHDHARRSRQLMTSDWYRARWGNLFRLIDDQRTKGYYENNRGGKRISTSVEGSATGFGGDVVVADDPHNAQESESEAKREAAVGWWNSTMATRGNEPGRSAWVAIQQRVDINDVAGSCIENGTYVRLDLPAEFIPKERCFTSWVARDGEVRTFEDPRTEDGELLWPDRLPLVFLDEQRESMGDDYDAQYQQRPKPPGGTMFRPEWFKEVDIYDVQLEDCDLVWFWDLAGTRVQAKKRPDWTVGILLARHRKTKARYVLEMIRMQADPADVEEAMIAAAERYGPTVPIRYEEEGGSSGKFATLSLTRRLEAYDFQGVPSTGDKRTRARPISGQAKGGLWHLVKAAWNKPFLKEFATFPKGANDDIVDACSGANKALTEGDTKAFSWSERHSVLGADEMIAYWHGRDWAPGDRFVPPRDWVVLRSHYIDPAGARPSVAVWIAAPPAGGEHGERRFVLDLLELEPGLALPEIMRRLDEREAPYKGLVAAALLPPEAHELQTAYARLYKRKTYLWDADPRAGVVPLRDALYVDPKRPHPYVSNLAGAPRLFLVVDPRERKRPLTENGMLDLRVAFDQYYPEDRASHPTQYPALCALLGAAQFSFGRAGRPTQEQRFEQSLPKPLRAEQAPDPDTQAFENWHQTRMMHLDMQKPRPANPRRRKGPLTPY